MLLGAAPAAASGPIFEVAPENMELSARPLKTTKPEQIKGVLPKGWQEDSAWADVWMQYTVEKGLPGQPKAYLRAQIDKCTRGQAQIKLPFEGKKDQQQFLKFILRARSLSGNNLTLMVRQHEAPYKAYWQANVKLDSVWRDYDIDVEINAPDEKLAALMVLGKGGRVDIAKFTLSQQTRDEVIEGLKREFPDGGPRNLLAHSRLPAGLPSGWTYASASSLGDELRIEPDPAKALPPEVPNLPGVAPLRISTRFSIPREDEGPPLARDADLGLVSEPFNFAAPYRVHTVSLYVAGSLENGKITVLADGQPLKDQGISVKPEDGWKRLSFNFMPKLLARQYLLRLEGRGEFWVDGWQINPGEKPAPLQPGGAGELTLVFGNDSRVIFPGDPVPLEAAVLNHNLPAEGAMLVAETVDAYGKVRSLARESVKRAGLTRFPLAEGASSENSGPVLVTAWLEAGGKRITPKEELIYNVVPRPASLGRDAPESFFGAHLPPTRRHIQMAKSIGINWVRLQDDGRDATAWVSVEPEEGVWAFPDAWVDRYRAGNLKILGRLSTVPVWARTGDYKENAHNADLYFRAAEDRQFAAYADRVVAHYAGRVSAWDVWRRPWDRFHTAYKKEAKDWNERYVQGPDALTTYAEYCRLAGAAITRHDPRALLVGVAGNYRGKGENWVDLSVKAGLVESSDVIGFQAYWTADRGSMVDPDGNYSALISRNIVAPLLESYPQVPRPLWMTEGSFSLGQPETGLQGWSRGPETQNRNLLWTLADRAVRFCVSAQALGVQKVFFYSMERGDPSRGAQRETRASLVGDDAYLAPSGVALAVFAKETEGRRLLRRVQISPGIYAAFYEGAGSTLAILLPGEGEQLTALSQLDGVEVRDIFGNSARGRSVDGSLYVETELPTAKLESRLRELLPPVVEKASQ
jgi:hypothetical protein